MQTRRTCGERVIDDVSEEGTKRLQRRLKDANKRAVAGLAHTLRTPGYVPDNLR